jgi:glucodextranase-like protein/PASTA domain-containing protein
MRRRMPLAAAAVCVLAGGCGGDGPAPAPVRLVLTAPRDQQVVRAASVELRGTVRPASATVTVRGRRATVSGGAFRATVALEPGTNVIDVLASAGRARPALTAIRVRRRVSVRVPDLVGVLAADVKARLTDLGLKADVADRDGIFERLLPGDVAVCSTSPDAGKEVDPGTTVHVVVSRRC